MSNKLNLHRSNDKWKCGRYNPHPIGIFRPLFPPKPISRGQWCQINSMKQSGQLSGAARSFQPLASSAVRPLGRPRPFPPSNQDKTLLRCKELAQASVNSNRQIRSRALESLRGNQEIQELVPGLCSFIVDGVKKCKGDNLSSLFYLLDMANCVNENPYLSIQGHIKDVLNAIGCCLTSRQIPVHCELGDHWKLRDLASRLLGRVCRRYSNGRNELADNLATTLFRYISAENPPLVALYGALPGLTELGPRIVQDTIIPNTAYISETIDRVTGSATDIMNAELVRSSLIKIVWPVLKTLENPPKLGSLGAYLQAESFHFPQRSGDGSFVKVGPGTFSSTYSGMSPSNSVNLCPVSQSSHGFVVQGNPTTGATPNMEAGTSTATAASAGAGGHHAPPSRTGEGASATERIQGDTMPDRRKEDTAAIKVSNLSKNAQETDLQELFKPFGHIARIFLAKDKLTGQCNGFAFVNYYKKEDAAKAIASLNGFNYDHLILSVEWTEPPGQIGKKAVSTKQTEGISSNSKRPSPSILTSGASNNSRSVAETRPMVQNNTSPTSANMVDPGVLAELHVYGVKSWVTEVNIRSNFSDFGTILGVYLSKVGYCHIKYSTREEAAACIEALNGQTVLGRTLKISWATTSKFNPHSPYYIFCERFQICYKFNIEIDGCEITNCPRKHCCLFCYELFKKVEPHRSKFECPSKKPGFMNFPPRDKRPQPPPELNTSQPDGDQLPESSTSSEPPKKKFVFAKR